MDVNGHTSGDVTRRGRTVSIRDVAAAAGVSYQTVSRVINDHPRVKASTREVVLAAIDELGFRPSRAARALAGGRVTAVTVLTSNTTRYGYASALQGIEEAARAAGFAAVERLAGGRAAVFHSGTIAIARAYSDPQPPKRTYARFEEMAELIAVTLRGLGVDARVGEVPGEYCPGAYSVNARGATKLAGIGQRMIRGGAHMGGVVVASGGGEVARALGPVYEALELDWDPATSGSVSEELGRAVDPGEVEEALIEIGRAHV